MGNPTEARTSYYIKVDAIPVCRRHKCKVRSNYERRRLCENVPLSSPAGVTEGGKKGDSLSFIHQTRVSSMYTFRQICTHERAYTFRRRWRPRYTRYLHVRGCDFGNCSTRATLNCKKRINFKIRERLETFAYRKFFDDYSIERYIIDFFLFVLLSCTSTKCNERELTVQWRSCSDSICFNSIKLQ